MDVLVVSGCSGDKMYDDPPISCGEIDSETREGLLRRYPDQTASAKEMYTGQEHGVVTSAVSNLREYADVTWKIISAGYGLLDETDEVVAYECSFTEIGPVQKRAKRLGYDPNELTHVETRQVVAREKGIPSELRRTTESGYDIVFFVLSKPYLVGVAETLRLLPDEVTAFAFASKGSKDYLGRAHWVPATEEVRAELRTSWFRIRGELLMNVTENLSVGAVSSLADRPSIIDRMSR